MKTIYTLLTILILAYFVFWKPAGPTPSYAANYVVELNSSDYESYKQMQHLLQVFADDIKIAPLAPRHKQSIDAANTYRLSFNTRLSASELESEFNRSGLFSDVEQETYAQIAGKKGFSGTPDDKYFKRQWAISNDGKFQLATSKARADIDMTDAWKIEQGDTAITVAILDGGCSMSDPDFAGRIWKNKKEIPYNGIDDDGNGYVDDIAGWDFVSQDNYPEDKEGHGTNVASIIGANANNGIGYTGIDWNCKLMVLKVVDDHGVGTYSDWAEAIYYAVDNGAKVINMSVGGVKKSRMLQEAIDYAYSRNVVVVASMMNNNTDTTYYPAGCKHVIAVGSTDPDDKRSAPFFWDKASGSNYGKNIDVVAPGNYIYGVAPEGYDVYWGGTSQAAPHVAGLVSLLFAQNPHRTADDVYNIITNTADDRVGNPQEDKPGWDKYYGYGRINAYAALSYGRTHIR